MKFKAGTISLQPGDTVFCYTDGVPEATDGEEKLFGTERMLQALNRQPDAGPKELDENVLTSIAEFVGDAPQFDDTTILCLKYYGRHS